MSDDQTPPPGDQTPPADPPKDPAPPPDPPKDPAPPADPPKDPAPPTPPADPDDDVIKDRAELARLRAENAELKAKKTAPAPPKKDPSPPAPPADPPKKRARVSSKYWGAAAYED